MLTRLERIVKTGIGDERDGRVEALGVLEDVERELDGFALELLLDALERLLHAEPEVDLLTRRAARDVAAQLGHGLDLLDPAVDLALQAVEEGRVGEEGDVNHVDGRASAARLGLRHGCGNGGMDREDNVRDLDVLLDCEELRDQLASSSRGKVDHAR